VQRTEQGGKKRGEQEASVARGGIHFLNVLKVSAWK